MNTGTAGIYIYVDGIQKALTKSRTKNENYGSITIQSTLKLAEDAKVEIRFEGQIRPRHDCFQARSKARLLPYFLEAIEIRFLDSEKYRKRHCSLLPIASKRKRFQDFLNIDGSRPLPTNFEG